LIEGYEISSNSQDMNLEVVHGFISRTYWAKGIPIATMQRAIENSLCFGVFTSMGEQIGFARMVTDSATFAYLADVFIHEDHRSKGLSKWLVQTIMEHPNLQGLRRMVLATADAHELYRRVGFTALAKPEIYMELTNPDVYQ